MHYYLRSRVLSHTSRPLDFFTKSFFLLVNECPCSFFKIVDHVASGVSPFSMWPSSHETWKQFGDKWCLSTRLSKTSVEFVICQASAQFIEKVAFVVQMHIRTIRHIQHIQHITAQKKNSRWSPLVLMCRHKIRCDTCFQCLYDESQSLCTCMCIWLTSNRQAIFLVPTRWLQNIALCTSW